MYSIFPYIVNQKKATIHAGKYTIVPWMLWVQTLKSKNGIYKILWFSQGIWSLLKSFFGLTQPRSFTTQGAVLLLWRYKLATQATWPPKMIHGEWYIYLKIWVKFMVNGGKYANIPTFGSKNQKSTIHGLVNIPGIPGSRVWFFLRLDSTFTWLRQPSTAWSGPDCGGGVGSSMG